MTMRNPSKLLNLGLLILLGQGCADHEAVGPIAMRRITADQYRQTIADVFGTDIRVVGRFEPDARRDGLLAVGTAWVAVTPVGFEHYDAIARRIAEQVVAPENRERFVPCTPIDPELPDADCSRQFIRKFGRQLLRRPLLDEEVVRHLAIAQRAAREMGDFYVGLRFALSGLLVSPEFLFRVERAFSDSSDFVIVMVGNHIFKGLETRLESVQTF